MFAPFLLANELSKIFALHSVETLRLSTEIAVLTAALREKTEQVRVLKSVLRRELAQ